MKEKKEESHKKHEEASLYDFVLRKKRGETQGEGAPCTGWCNKQQSK